MMASILIVDDQEDLRRALGDRCRHWGHRVFVAADGADALAQTERQAFDLIFLDLSMPGLPGLEVLERLKATECSADVVVLTAHGSLQNVVEAIKRGAEDFLTKPADFDLLQRVIDRSLARRQLARINASRAAADVGPVVGPSESMRRVLEIVERAAKADSTVLLTGESGTGKQVLAEHFHARSGRARGPFAYVNCVAISDDLIESTLFGHERGAFTGAVARKTGRLEIAAGGTAFLDEVGDISGSLQTKLLHFLEAGEFERVGGNQTVRVDCRVIAATNRDLVADVAAGRFREDLYYRLNVIALRVPPLRERAEDIPMLAERFLVRVAADLKRPRLAFEPRVLEVMAGYAWPGNVRQLKNAVERMAVLAPGETLNCDLLPPEVLTGPAATVPTDEPPGAEALPYREALAASKRSIIQAALARSDGNQTKAAAQLGLQRSHLNRMLRDLGLAG
jgi:two-component system response regulator HydG